MLHTDIINYGVAFPLTSSESFTFLRLDVVPLGCNSLFMVTCALVII